MMTPSIPFRIKLIIRFPEETKVINHAVIKGVPKLQHELAEFGLELSRSRLYRLQDAEYLINQIPDWMNPFPEAIEKHIRVIRCNSIEQAYSK